EVVAASAVLDARSTLGIGKLLAADRIDVHAPTSEITLGPGAAPPPCAAASPLRGQGARAQWPGPVPGAADTRRRAMQLACHWLARASAAISRGGTAVLTGRDQPGSRETTVPSITRLRRRSACGRWSPASADQGR